MGLLSYLFERKETKTTAPVENEFSQKREVSPVSLTPQFSAKETGKAIIATARPGLAGAESALMRRLPSSYTGKTVRDVLSYIVESNIKDNEAATAASLRNELGAAGSAVVINGRDAKLTDKVEQYLVDKTKDVGGREVQYQELEIEVSAVQQGGYRFY